ncbi:MAG: DUF4867 family protein [Clostridia bacterium]|nr:DUF4867 family protein [Clostridia bacterium]
MLIQKVTDASFTKYGKVITGIDCSDIIEAMGATPCPENVVYVPSLDTLEACKSAEDVFYSMYGGMPYQIGYCNGNNYMLNALEYHRDSEVDIAVTDLILLLGAEQDIVDGKYDTAKVEAFYVPAGTAVEVYGTTLHYAPCNAAENGFKCVIILPKGTNTDIEKRAPKTAEDEMLFARNKWLLAHPDAAEPGQYVGLVGENLSVK